MKVSVTFYQATDCIIAYMVQSKAHMRLTWVPFHPLVASGIRMLHMQILTVMNHNSPKITSVFFVHA